jgi:hypothetical protein
MDWATQVAQTAKKAPIKQNRVLSMSATSTFDGDFGLQFLLTALSEVAA